MFKKIFSRSSSSKTNIPSSVPANKPSSSDNQNQKEQKNEKVAMDSMNKAKRQLYKFDMPTTDMGFQDLLKSYEEGNRFQYVALSGGTEESYESRVRKMVTLHIKTDKKGEPKVNVPLIKLTENNIQYHLGQVVSVKKGPSYIRLASMLAVYTPLVSSFSEFSTVSLTLHDTRKISNTAIQTAKFNSNLQNKVELSLDFCVPRASAGKIILDVSLEQATLMQGEEWGTLSLIIVMESSEAPYVTNLKDVVSVVAMPPALLGSYTNNPNYIDTTITESHRKNVRDMYESGDIADETEPMKEELKAVTYARSSVAPKKKGPKSGKSFGKGWEHLDGFRKPVTGIDEASYDPEGSVDLKVDTAAAREKMKMKEIASESGSDLSENFLENHPASGKAVKGVKFNELEV
ncbi:movement protein [Edgeworthia chrysantha mosaic-associated virus]|uniref:Movement protein n=1 Tax=Edgeworthia chrysantha mosaic-associated virus TaxID=2992856 RepID=A0A9E7V729_9VIRU|nr:movement protein [Edgeworthia chrysantha mosaic-associated virus]